MEAEFRGSIGEGLARFYNPDLVIGKGQVAIG
jgi:hypothetical protein